MQKHYKDGSLCFRFEWIAYDTHSGIKQISWRLFDNYTTIEHGRAPIGHQGGSSVSYAKFNVFVCLPANAAKK